MGVKENRLNLEKSLSNILNEIKNLQDSCQHLDTKKEYGSNTGNYDPSSDYYWIDFTCLDCNKKWTKRQ